jgi:hypothetical protein
MKSLSEGDTSLSQETETKVGKKAYVSPNLLEYGTVAKLTQNGTGTATDAQTGPNKMACL